MTGHADEQLEERLNYRFRSRELLEKALTHSSAVSEARAGRTVENAAGEPLGDNERLEFLGDAVLELVTREYLVSRFPDWDEGRLSKSRTRLVNAKSLEAAARRLAIGEHLRLGRGEEKTGGREKQTLLADAFEALVAAIYLDGGFEVARNFVLRNIVGPELERMEEGGGALPVTDFKSALQEAVQGLGLSQPVYVLVDEVGPEHSKTFTVEARLNSKNGKDPEFVGRAQGLTKKTAEQDAARQLLTFLASRSKTAETKPTAGTSQSAHK